jgi:hypothetical protein
LYADIGTGHHPIRGVELHLSRDYLWENERERISRWLWYNYI